jgi:hypothetical protein
MTSCIAATFRSRRATGITALGLTLAALAGSASAAEAAAEPTALNPQPTTLVASLLQLKVTYSATLVSRATGAGIAGETVSFTQGSAHCAGVSGFGGAVSCSVPVINILSVLLGQPYTATFAGSPTHGASSATGLSTLA